MKFLRRLLCRHDLVFVRNLYGDQIIAHGYRRSEWRCKRCGKLIFLKDLHN